MISFMIPYFAVKSKKVPDFSGTFGSLDMKMCKIEKDDEICVKNEDQSGAYWIVR